MRHKCYCIVLYFVFVLPKKKKKRWCESRKSTMTKVGPIKIKLPSGCAQHSSERVYFGRFVLGLIGLERLPSSAPLCQCGGSSITLHLGICIMLLL